VSRLLRAALLAYPRECRERDGEVLLDCAAELARSGSSPVREAAGLVGGGLAARARAACRDVLDAPWGAALERMAVPLAASNLALWAVGAARVWSPGPLGRWWSLILAGAFLAFVGAVARRRGLALLGWAVCLLLVAQTLVTAYLTQQASRFGASLGSLGVDMPAAFAPAMLLGLVAATRLRGAVRPQDLAWAAPVVALVVLSPQAPGGPLGEFPADTLLIAGLLAAPVLAALVAPGDAVRLMVAAALAGVVAPEALWLSTGAIALPDLPDQMLMAYWAGCATVCAVAIGTAVRRAGRRWRGQRSVTAGPMSPR
jgi:hypothetical protein